MAGKAISSLSVILGATVKPFVSAFNGVKSVVGNFTSSIGGAAGTLLRLTGIGAAVGATFAAIKSAASGISLAAELEQTEVAFRTMLGSADQATAMMQQLQGFAAATPFEFPEIASSAKSLLAFGIGAGDIAKTLQMVGDVASGVGVPLNELAQIYGKAKTQGRLYAEDINQLTGRGIPIIKELAKQFGVSEAEVKKLVESGAVGFPQLQKAFESMTGSGGQFAGLMEAQSQTLAGLWSTLSDTIGMTLAGLTTTIVKAFNVKGAMSSLIAGIGRIGASLQTFVSTYAPLVVSFAARIWSAITSAASAIYSYVAPIVSSIAGVVAANWQSIVSTTLSYWTAAYNLVASLLGAAWSIVSAVWTGIAAVWQWGCSLIGYSTQETGSTTGNVVQGIVDWWQWAASTVAEALTLITFGINNARTIVEYFGTSAAYYVVQFANVVEWGFNAAVSYVVWFGQNFTSLIVDYFNVATTITTNGIGNVARIISNLPGLIAGTTSLADIWTPLTQGFVATASALPTIAARIPGELETALGAQSEAIGSSLVDGAIGALDDLDKQTASVTSSIASTTAGIGDTLAAAAPPEIKTPKLYTAGVSAAADAMGALSDKTKEAKASWEALAYGSAEAQQASAIAAMQTSLAASKPGTSAAAASASPLPKSATSAIAKSAEAKSTKDDTNYAKLIFEWLKANGIGPDLVEAA